MKVTFRALHFFFIRLPRILLRFFSSRGTLLTLLIVSNAFWLYVAVWVEGRLTNVESRFGGEKKLACQEKDLPSQLNKSVVRIIGSLSEGSGFPINEREIVTNFHVIENEPSPKIILSDGSIFTTNNIAVDKEKDIAYLMIAGEELPWIPLATATDLQFGEPVYAAGYPFGSDFPGDVVISRGSYGGRRFIKELGINVLQTNISVNPGMSGGPLVDQCGNVLGITTAGVAGLSVFLDIDDVMRVEVNLSSPDIARIEIDTSTPEGAIRAFYAYIKARDLQKAYELLTPEFLDGKPFEEWTEGYANTLHVEPIMIKPHDRWDDVIRVKLVSSDWVDGELVRRYFEGTWRVREEEDGTYRLHEAAIVEVEDPDILWFYDAE